MPRRRPARSCLDRRRAAGHRASFRLEALTEINGQPWASMAEFNLLDANGAPIAAAGWAVSADSAEPAGHRRRGECDRRRSATLWHTPWVSRARRCRTASRSTSAARDARRLSLPAAQRRQHAAARSRGCASTSAATAPTGPSSLAAISLRPGAAGRRGRCCSASATRRTGAVADSRRPRRTARADRLADVGRRRPRRRPAGLFGHRPAARAVDRARQRRDQRHADGGRYLRGQRRR